MVKQTTLTVGSSWSMPRTANDMGSLLWYLLKQSPARQAIACRKF